jgi:putative copper resistance protein D
MQAFANFSDSLLSGALLICLSLALGSFPWAFFALPSWEGRSGERSLRRCVGLLAVGASGLALCQTAALALKFIVVSGFLDAEAFGRFSATLQFRAGSARIVLAVLLAAAAWRLRREPRSRRRWAAVAALAAALAVSGAWLVHGVGRPEGRIPLMALTVLHQVGAAIWVGGVIQLAALWRLARRTPDMDATWAQLVRRFSRVAVVALVVLVAAALPLAWLYVGSWGGLIGTGYGSLIVTKIGLMVAALVLGALNFAAGRGAGGSGALRTRVPYLVEAEALLLGVLLFTAATVSTQPPAIDVLETRAAWGEVVDVFRPKWPTLRTPSIATMATDSSDVYAVIGGERTAAAYTWSNFSHNVAGLLLFCLCLAAFAAWSGRGQWARHWPLGFVGLGIFIFLRTSADSNTWPFGPVPFWSNTLGDAEVLQHRLGALLPVALGIMEWRARMASERGRRRLAYVFPILACAGGVLLLTHSHAAFEGKSDFLVQVTHTAMGALAVVLACARLLELRLPPPASRVAGLVSILAMLLIALVLIFYREANVEVPVDGSVGVPSQALETPDGTG